MNCKTRVSGNVGKGVLETCPTMVESNSLEMGTLALMKHCAAVLTVLAN